MANFQIINVPFTLPFDIFQYVEAMGLTLTTSGSYFVLPYANDNFNFAPSGFNNFVSGSGSWGGSGYAFVPIQYMYDNFASYSTGTTTGYLFSGNTLAAYSITVPNFYSGSMTLNTNYMYDNFSSYSTGLFTLPKLQNGTEISGYNIVFPNNYNGIFNFGLTNKTGSFQVNDSANTGIIWSGTGFNVGPGVATNFNYIQPGASNYLQIPTGAYYAAGSGNIPFPWTGGGPVLVGGIVVNEGFLPFFNVLIPTKSGYLTTTGINTATGASAVGLSGVITGDFTMNIIWNWNQQITPNANNIVNSTNFSFLIGVGSGTVHAGVLTGFGVQTLNPSFSIINGGPYPDSQNYGPNYLSTGGYSFQNAAIFPTMIGTDCPLVDFDILSGFGIYLYPTMWSGITWLATPNLSSITQSSTSLGTFEYQTIVYTGFSSGVVLNPYVYINGNKISGASQGINLTTSSTLITGYTGFSGAVNGFIPANPNQIYYQTGYCGGMTGIVVNGNMVQFTGFGLGTCQYLTLSRSGSFVTLYQSGLVFATGTATGNLTTKRNMLIGEFQTGLGTGSFTGYFGPFGLFHFDLYNYCLPQSTIQSGLLTYQNPPISGMIASTNFFLR